MSSDNASNVSNALAATKTQGGVQSLEIGLSILDVLIAHNKPMMLKDIAQAMQMHPAKTHRYLVSLIRKNYACKLDDSRYALGERVNNLAALGALGQTPLTQHNILERLTTVANEIKNTLNCGVQIAKWFSEGPIIIGSVEPDSPISIITRIGSRMPITTSATGQLFASYQSDTVIKSLALTEWQNKIDRACSLSDTEIAAKWQYFSQQQSAIRRQGYASVTGDMVAGINAISIPVLALAMDTLAENSPLEYAITIIGTSEQLPLSQQPQIAAKILTIAKRYQLA